MGETTTTTMPGRALGVLGGMGPLAGAQFMVRLTQLTPAERDQEVPAGATLEILPPFAGG